MPSQQIPALLDDTRPLLANEITRALVSQGERGLASQVHTLPIVEPCGCGDDFCISFFTGPRPDRRWADEGDFENIEVAVSTGYTILDLVDGIIRYVEVLYWWTD